MKKLHEAYTICLKCGVTKKELARDWRSCWRRFFSQRHYFNRKRMYVREEYLTPTLITNEKEV